MIRTHEAGTLRASHAGEYVVLAGWVARRRDHGGVVFIDLRDASGLVQVVWRGEEAPSQEAGAHELRAEFCVLVTGTVRQRPAGNENPDLPGGDYPTILRSLARVCLSLPDETVVLSGHGPQTTIGAERRTNPFLSGLEPSGPSAPASGPTRGL